MSAWLSRTLPALLAALVLVVPSAEAQSVPDTVRADSARRDSARRDSTRRDSLRVDSLRVDSAPPVTAPADVARVAASPLAADAARGRPRLPISGGDGGRVLHVQVLLGAAGFSPGIIDGRWQAGTRAAVRAFREARGLDAGDAVDEATYERLLESAHRRPPLVEYRLARQDLRGPLRRIPASYHDRARLDCLCYESVAERVAERFHTTPGVLRALNPGLVLDSAAVGTPVTVPNVWRLPPRAPARLVVDKQGGTLRGYADDGALLFSLRASVGSAQTPSPSGRLRVLSVTHNPWYQYNPRVLSGNPRVKGRTADLPPGPNSPVGLVWIQLNKAHIGIHGTPEPARVGAAQSHGCVRLTNWDALFLASAVVPGTAVEFL